jgi:L-ascorbate metabolism protein UlaG (beta-lactamase superfamily)
VLRAGADGTADTGVAAHSRPDGLSATWLGHATVVIDLDGARFVSDPVLKSRVGPLRRMVPAVDPDAARDIDMVLLSHLHADHAESRSLRTIGSATTILAPAGSRRLLAARGVRNVRELAAGEWVSCGAVGICATPARHGRGRHGRAGGAAAIGFLLFGSQSCYFAGDTDIFTGMGRLAGGLDLALVPVAGWGPTLGPGHLDPGRAAQAVALLAPRVAVPIHWGTFAPVWPARLRPDLSGPGPDFAAEVARSAAGVHVRVLAPGERLEMAPRSEVHRRGAAP